MHVVGDIRECDDCVCMYVRMHEVVWLRLSSLIVPYTCVTSPTSCHQIHLFTTATILTHIHRLTYFTLSITVSITHPPHATATSLTFTETLTLSSEDLHSILAHRFGEGHAYRNIHTCMHTYIHTYIHTYVHTCIQNHTYMHAYVYTYAHIEACAHIYIVCMFMGNAFMHLYVDLSVIHKHSGIPQCPRHSIKTAYPQKSILKFTSDHFYSSPTTKISVTFTLLCLSFVFCFICVFVFVPLLTHPGVFSRFDELRAEISRLARWEALRSFFRTVARSIKVCVRERNVVWWRWVI